MQTCAYRYCKKNFETSDSRKMYCSRQCQVENNNERAREQSERFLVVNTSLRRNYFILESVLDGKEQTETTRAQLEQNGFNFYALTGIAKYKGQTVPSIYDIGIVQLNESTYQILQLNGND
jgi:hypothetical protein